MKARASETGPPGLVLSERARRRSWRDADPARKSGPRPTSVRAVVRAITRSLFALRLVEGALLTVAFTCSTMAAAYWSGLESARVDAVLVALFSGVAGGLSWFLEQRSSESEVVRRLDRRLRHGGALVTAWEIESDPQLFRQPLARLCFERVLDRLRTPEALQVCMPSLAPPVLLPLAGAALLGIALDAHRGPTETRFLPLDGLAQELSSLSSAALRSRGEDKISPADLKSLLQAKQELESLRLEAGGSRTPQDAAERSRALDERLSRLNPGLARDPELQREVAELRARLDAMGEAFQAHETAAAPRGSAAGEPGERPGERDAGVDGGGLGGPTSKGSSDSGPPELATGEEDGTMTDPIGSPQNSSGLGHQGDLSEGPIARVWWDRIDDPLVADWVELLRQAQQEPVDR